MVVFDARVVVDVNVLENVVDVVVVFVARVVADVEVVENVVNVVEVEIGNVSIVWSVALSNIRRLINIFTNPSRYNILF